MAEMNPARDAWLAALELLRMQGDLSDSQSAFVRMAHPLATAEDIFMIVVGSEFVKNWIEEHVADLMTGALSNILGHNIRLVISIDPSVNESPLPAAERRESRPVETAPAPRRAETPTALSPDSEWNQSATYRDFTREEPGGYPEFPAEPVAAAAPSALSSPRVTAPVEKTEPTSLATLAMASGEEKIYGNSADPSFAAMSTAAGLNPKYTFDNFVIGDSNRFPTATSLAVSEAPGTTYNPLFLYSDSGMGKTHLMHAIGNYAISLYPNIHVRYISAEEFTNAFINAVRDGRQSEFKDSFRKVDILLIDDIQFIGGRDTTVEEFFHTFNALTNSNKQIVITSDVAPNLLNGFEERMLSRFNSGVVASIDRPNLETRIAILEKKAHVDGISVPREVHEYIATHMTTNVREMEGALRRVTAFADLSKQPVSLTLSEMVLKDLITNPDSVDIKPSLIMAQTANYFSITIDDLTSADRSRIPVTARQIAMYLCREMTDLSLPKIGSLFGGRDHTTVMHAYRKIDKQMAERQTTYNQVSELSVRIKQAASQAE
ncbi:chromosomal replication initiator protein DnaA [Actinotignum sp. GS-2025f]|uniref:chromosomal replication initiator protein DnaA n=1 Tax=Actinotignum TaxID=1653174 RepID=UPI002550835C|nr:MULTISPECIES: chromosomal replication initiator protein DnaA [Actinotignum]MDK8782224.1 chromosomal replication initiator protein DnaA [Actinotignum timonense]MDY5127073.1 chromosomal replication initiator protein DnaA [Actinotignum sp. SLA_B059]